MTTALRRPVLCLECTLLLRAYEAARTRKKRLRRARRGQCRDCGRPREPDSSHCRRCRQKASAQRRARRQGQP